MIIFTRISKISDVSKKFISINLLRNGYYENNFEIQISIKNKTN